MAQLHSLSTADDYQKLFDQAKANAAETNIQIETGSKFRQQTLNSFNMMYFKAQEREVKGQYSFNGSVNTDNISCNQICIKPLSELQSTNISKLKVNKINYDVKLEATIITKPFQIIGCNMIIEDAQNNVIILSLYNYFALHQKLDTLAATLPIGTKIIIKEPYCKKSSGGSIAIRIDNPHCNFIIVDPLQDVIGKTIMSCNDPELLKQKGNEMVKMKLYKNAIKYYSAALNMKSISTDLYVKLLSNRILCFLKLKRFKVAIIDGKQALNMNVTGAINTKIRFRLGSALVGIGQYMEAWLILAEPTQQIVSSNSIQKQITKLEFQATRNYNESIDNDIEYDYSNVDWNDIANYYNDIKIKYINKSKGRGIVATSNMKRGERILMEKCIAFGLKNKKHFSASIDLEKSKYNRGSHIGLTQNMIEMYMNGTVVDRYRISLLHAGAEYSKDKNKTNIPKLEVFKYYELPDYINQCDVKMLSVSQIDEIATKNSFVMGDEDGCGLFGVASFFNHDDKPNATYSIFKRRIYVTLNRDVRKGEEICIKYHEKGVKSWID
eukprot:190998_1